MVYQKSNGNNVEKKVLDLLLDHVRIVNNSVEVLAQIVDNWKTPGRTIFNQNIKQLDGLEVNANTIKNEAMKEISDAGPILLFRQDLMRIIRASDQIVDLAQGAAFFLLNIDDSWIPPEEISNNIQELIDKTQFATKSLIDLYRALYQSLNKVKEISEQIEVTENKADANYRILIIALAKLRAPEGVPILVREAVERIEDMIDSVRDVASYLRMYALSR